MPGTVPGLNLIKLETVKGPRFYTSFKLTCWPANVSYVYTEDHHTLGQKHRYVTHSKSINKNDTLTLVHKATIPIGQWDEGHCLSLHAVDFHYRKKIPKLRGS